MNIIVSNAKTTAEYKMKKAVIRQLAENVLEKFHHGDPDGVWFKNGELIILYTNGEKWIYTPDGNAFQE